MRFRVAEPAPTAWNLTKTALQTSVFWTLFLFALPTGIRALEAACGIPPVDVPHRRAIGVVAFALCGAVALTSGAYMAWIGRGTPLPLDTARALVVRGPYRHVRNPMAVAGIGQGIAVGVYLGSIAVVLYAVAGAVVWDRWVRPIEERDLEQRFGDAFGRYRDAVRCWWPRWRAWRDDAAV